MSSTQQGGTFYDACGTCRLREHLEDACVLDTSGGAGLTLCTHCRDRLERRAEIFQSDVCVLCTEHSNPSKASGLHWFDGEYQNGKDVLHICDDCRWDLITSMGRVVRA